MSNGPNLFGTPFFQGNKDHEKKSQHEEPQGGNEDPLYGPTS
jgi:hypothetical protein